MIHYRPLRALRLRIASVAGLDLGELVEAINAGDVSRRETALRRANRALKQFFATVWTQSSLTVELQLDGALMLVNIVEDDESVTPFDERSSGLRAFVSLVTFLRARAVRGDVVLLIDEAENHLHIDAQIDLVNMLSEQEEASRVIYTTHSPACLPLDLGRSVRAILPSGTSDQRSRVSNSFWTEPGPGFSPLLVAMGAGAAAFSVARRVVLGEGATEMLLLPSLLRSAEPARPLDFQVAPGLAETPATFYESLDLQGARVAYLVDGDSAGTRLKAGLIDRGIPESAIVQIGLPTLEHFIDRVAYLTTIRELASESLGGTEIVDLPEVSDIDDLAGQIGAWLSSYGARMPSKVAVANRLLEMNRVSVAEERLDDARRLRAMLDAALGPVGRSRSR
jgi:predicted ATP-dependent endonuclease of OLD family